MRCCFARPRAKYSKLTIVSTQIVKCSDTAVIELHGNYL